MSRGVTVSALRKLCLSYPGVEEGLSYGTPAFRVRGKLLARLWEDGEVLVLKAGAEQRELLIAAGPDAYFITDHYRGSDYLLVRLPSVGLAELRDLFEEAWRTHAPKRLAASFDS